jgi:hypothetical protein
MKSSQKLPIEHTQTNEQKRLNAARETGVPWKKWGPYLSERQWGTVREDYSQDGNAWSYFSHDQARARAYRWGEDGLAGISDDKQRLCFAIALWNGLDPILKERLAGLGASHQTGWTGIIARTLDLFARGSAQDWLHIAKDELGAKMTREQVAGS